MLSATPAVSRRERVFPATIGAMCAGPAAPALPVFGGRRFVSTVLAGTDRTDRLLDLVAKLYRSASSTASTWSR
jgi:hypothetical protein